MTNLIDKSMLLKAINESIDYHFDRSEGWKKQGMDTKARESYECAVAIESLRSAIYSERFDVKINEWIDAKVTRPEKPGEYLIYNIAGREIGKYGEDGKWRVMSFDFFDSPEWIIDTTVTHWMDLPDNPSGN